MKKKMHYLCTLAAVAMLVLSLAGCKAKEETVNEYKSPNEMYSVSLPGEWTEEDNMGMDVMMALSREDGLGTVALGIVKSQVTVEDLDGFMGYVEETFLNGSFATSDLKDTEAVKIEGMSKSIASEGTMTQTDGASGIVFIQCMETEKAYYLLMISANKGQDKKLDAVKEKMLLKELEVKEPGDDTPETVRWFNGTYALLTKLNSGNINLPGGFEPSEVIAEALKASVKRDWEITDKASADEMVEWLRTEGHNKDALDYLKSMELEEDLSRDDLKKRMAENGFTSEQEAVLLAIFDAEAAYGEKAILAWDESRIMSVIGSSYLAGYYTYEEAMDLSLEVAKEIQKNFSSWDDFMKSYFYGYCYWSGESLEDASSQAAERQKIYEELKAEENSVFSLDWNMELTKEW